MSSNSSTMPSQDAEGHGSVPRNHGVKPIMLAHGVLMCIAFSFFFPAGGILLRVLKGKKTAHIHAYWQAVSWILAVAGFGAGVYMSAHGGHGTFTSSNGHKQIGLLVIIIMTLQPIIGIAHHLIFKEANRATVYGYVHRILGRVALIVGGVNVGLGAQLGHATLQRTVAYAAVTAFFFGAYFTVTLLFGPEAQKYKTIVGSGDSTPRTGSVDTTNNSADVEKDTVQPKI